MKLYDNELKRREQDTEISIIRVTRYSHFVRDQRDVLSMTFPSRTLIPAIGQATKTGSFRDVRAIVDHKRISLRSSPSFSDYKRISLEIVAARPSL